MHGQCLAQPAAQQRSTRCFYSLFFPSPTDALIGLNVWCRMAALAPVRQGLHGLRTFSFHNFSLHTFTDPAWASAHSGGPHAGVMHGGSGSTPMCSSMWRMSAL